MKSLFVRASPNVSDYYGARLRLSISVYCLCFWSRRSIFPVEPKGPWMSCCWLGLDILSSSVAFSSINESLAVSSDPTTGKNAVGVSSVYRWVFRCPDDLEIIDARWLSSLEDIKVSLIRICCLYCSLVMVF